MKRAFSFFQTGLVVLLAVAMTGCAKNEPVAPDDSMPRTRSTSEVNVMFTQTPANGSADYMENEVKVYSGVTFSYTTWSYVGNNFAGPFTFYSRAGQFMAGNLIKFQFIGLNQYDNIPPFKIERSYGSTGYNFNDDAFIKIFEGNHWYYNPSSLFEVTDSMHDGGYYVYRYRALSDTEYANGMM